MGADDHMSVIRSPFLPPSFLSYVPPSQLPFLENLQKGVRLWLLRLLSQLEKSAFARLSCKLHQFGFANWSSKSYKSYNTSQYLGLELKREVRTLDSYLEV